APAAEQATAEPAQAAQSEQAAQPEQATQPEPATQPEQAPAQSSGDEQAGGAAGATPPGDRAAEPTEEPAQAPEDESATDAATGGARPDPPAETPASTGDGEGDSSTSGTEPSTVQPMAEGSASDVWSLQLSGSPRNRATVEQGETIEYRLTAINEHQREVTGASATLDLSDVLASADLSTPLPDDVTREGSTLTW